MSMISDKLLLRSTGSIFNVTLTVNLLVWHGSRTQVTLDRYDALRSGSESQRSSERNVYYSYNLCSSKGSCCQTASPGVDQDTNSKFIK